MKPVYYVFSLPVVAVLAVLFYLKYSSVYVNLSGEEVAIFWGMVIYVFSVAIGVSRFCIWGFLVGVMTAIIARYVFAALMPDHQTEMFLATCLVYLLVFLPANFLQESKKGKH